LDLDGDIPLAPEVLQSLFHLTLTEAKIAIQIASGRDVTDVARLHKVSVGTVRNHMKKIHSKLDVSRRSELVRLVSSVARLASSR
jgi:DNA-binding CsgD family transcriptional regulator